MTLEEVKIPCGQGEFLSGRIYSPDIPSKNSIIFSHGLLSGKDGYKITKLAPHLSEANFSVLSFDFSYLKTFSNPVSEISVEKSVRDLACSVRFMRDRGAGKVHLMGSSMGGVISMIYTSANTDISSLIVIASPVKLEELNRVFGAGDVNSLDPEGSTKVQDIFIHNPFFMELGSLDMLGLLKNISIPMLLLYGSDDKIVDVSNSDEIAKYVSGKARRVIIEGGDHNLVRKGDIAILKDETVNWLKGFR